MLSGSGSSGSRPVVLGASTTATGLTLLPNTGGRNWLVYTAFATLGIGIIMLALQVVASVERRRK